MFRKSNKSNILTVMGFLILGIDGAQAFCSCWDSRSGPAGCPFEACPGSHCGGGIDWDTGYLSWSACNAICAKKWPKHTLGYIDENSMKNCKIQHPDAVIKPSDQMKKVIGKVSECEISEYIFAVLSLGILQLDELSHSTLCDELKAELAKM